MVDSNASDNELLIVQPKHESSHGWMVTVLHDQSCSQRDVVPYPAGTSHVDVVGILDQRSDTNLRLGNAMITTDRAILFAAVCGRAYSADVDLRSYGCGVAEIVAGPVPVDWLAPQDSASLSVDENTILGFARLDAESCRSISSGKRGKPGVVIVSMGNESENAAVRQIVPAAACDIGIYPLAFHEPAEWAISIDWLSQTQLGGHLNSDVSMGAATKRSEARSVDDVISCVPPIESAETSIDNDTRDFKPTVDHNVISQDSGVVDLTIDLFDFHPNHVAARNESRSNDENSVTVRWSIGGMCDGHATNPLDAIDLRTSLGVFSDQTIFAGDLDDVFQVGIHDASPELLNVMDLEITGSRFIGSHPTIDVGLTCLRNDEATSEELGRFLLTGTSGSFGAYTFANLPGGSFVVTVNTTSVLIPSMGSMVDHGMPMMGCGDVSAIEAEVITVIGSLSDALTMDDVSPVIDAYEINESLTIPDRTVKDDRAVKENVETEARETDVDNEAGEREAVEGGETRTLAEVDANSAMKVDHQVSTVVTLIPSIFGRATEDDFFEKLVLPIADLPDGMPLTTLTAEEGTDHISDVGVFESISTDQNCDRPDFVSTMTVISTNDGEMPSEWSLNLEMLRTTNHATDPCSDMPGCNHVPGCNHMPGFLIAVVATCNEDTQEKNRHVLRPNLRDRLDLESLYVAVDQTAMTTHSTRDQSDAISECGFKPAEHRPDPPTPATQDPMHEEQSHIMSAIHDAHMLPMQLGMAHHTYQMNVDRNQPADH